LELTKLNTYAEEYRVTRTDVDFRRLYDEAWRVFGRVNRCSIVKSRLGDESDADCIFDTVIWKLAQRSDLRDFGKVLSSSLRKARLCYFRDESRRRTRVPVYLDKEISSDEGALTLKDRLRDEYRVEDDVLQKKETDQLQLIDFLLDRVNDPVTTLIVTQFKSSNCGKMSITALAKALGLHHETVLRKLRSLVRHYDANRFGDYYEYLAV